MLRRPKNTINLPLRQDMVHSLLFSREEREVCEAVRAQTIGLIEQDLTLGVPSSGSYSNALERINQLRKICNLGVSSTYPTPPQSTPSTPDSNQNWTVKIAQDTLNNLITVGEASCSSCFIELGMAGTEAQLVAKDLSQPLLSQCLYLWCGRCSAAAQTNGLRYVDCGHQPACPFTLVSTVLSQTSSTTPSNGIVASTAELPTKIKALEAELRSLDGGI